MVYCANGVNSRIGYARIAAHVKISSIGQEAPFNEANKRKNLTLVPVGVDGTRYDTPTPNGYVPKVESEIRVREGPLERHGAGSNPARGRLREGKTYVAIRL